MPWGTELDDRILKGYEFCTLGFTKRDFNRARDGKITLYVNHPTRILSWIETCSTVEEKKCETINLEQGLKYTLTYNPDVSVLYIFENDGPSEEIFQLEY